MPAAVLKGPGRLEVEEIPIPSLGGTDVLVEIDRCGVCGSDLHMVLEGWAQPGSVPGHEWNGVVVAVGDAVTRSESRRRRRRRPAPAVRSVRPLPSRPPVTVRRP